MICISKKDLEGMLKDMLADIKGKEHKSNSIASSQISLPVLTMRIKRE